MLSRWKNKLPEVKHLYQTVNDVTETVKDNESDEDANEELAQTPELRSSEAELNKLEPIQRPEEIPTPRHKADDHDQIEAYADPTSSPEPTVDWKA